MAKRGSTNRGKARKTPAIRCDSPKATEETIVRVSMSKIERQLITTCCTWRGESITEYIRCAAMARAVHDVKAANQRTQAPAITPIPPTAGDAQDTEVIVASALQASPNNEAITNLAADLASLLSVD